MPDPPIPPRFIADVMLGRLARWLRILGYDVLYSNGFADEEIVALAQDDFVTLSWPTFDRLIWPTPDN